MMTPPASPLTTSDASLLTPLPNKLDTPLPPPPATGGATSSTTAATPFVNAHYSPDSFANTLPRFTPRVPREHAETNSGLSDVNLFNSSRIPQAPALQTTSQLLNSHL